MESFQLKARLETLCCHIHGDAAHVTVAEDNSVEIETCCLLFRQQLLLMAGNDESKVRGTASM